MGRGILKAKYRNMMNEIQLQSWWQGSNVKFACMSLLKPRNLYS